MLLGLEIARLRHPTASSGFNGSSHMILLERMAGCPSKGSPPLAMLTYCGWLQPSRSVLAHSFPPGATVQLSVVD